MVAPSAQSAESLEGRHAAEVAKGERFAFGKNWASFLRVLDEERIRAAEAGLTKMLGPSLAGLRFLDIGSGSGLSSLAARRIGAEVVSFDYDPQSVACTNEVRRRYFPDDPRWRVLQGSVLDAAFLSSLGSFDVVYSWGVLHHTGAMWPALDLAQARVAEEGRLHIAIYNDQGAWSGRWRRIKRLYCSGPLGRSLVTGTIVPWWVLRGLLADLVWMRNPLERYRTYRHHRGMSVVHDWLDWLGGYPFEYAKPEALLDHLAARDFRLDRLRTVGGSMGCNEYVFRRRGAQR